MHERTTPSGGARRLGTLLAVLTATLTLGCAATRPESAPPAGKPEPGAQAAADKPTGDPVAKPGEQPLVPGTKGGVPVAAVGKRSVVRFGRSGMGTFIEFLVATDRTVDAQGACAAAFDEVARIESVMSEWKEGSEVSRINKAAGESPVEVSAELMGVLKIARRISELSDGAFDVTWAALDGLWGFDQDNPRVPSHPELAARISLVGHKRMRLEDSPPAVMLEQKGMAVGLGGIAKGYAVDRAAAILREKGFNDFIVYAGGDLYVSGEKSPGVPWTVGIQHPRVRGALISAFPAPGGAVVTSGDYERYIEKDGVRYHHIIDLRTGKPARRAMAVTVLAKEAVMADAISTAIFVLGPEKGIALAEKVDGVEAVVIDPKGTPYLSKGLQGKVVVRPATLR